MTKGFEHEIVDIADDFYKVYRRCGEGKNPRTDEWGRYVTDVVSVPEVVNGLLLANYILKICCRSKRGEARMGII